jgi:hypothetical protein
MDTGKTQLVGLGSFKILIFGTVGLLQIISDHLLTFWWVQDDVCFVKTVPCIMGHRTARVKARLSGQQQIIQ